MAILLTGFEPFAEHKVNPTKELVESIQRELKEGVFTLSQPLQCLVLPVDYELSWKRLSEALETIRAQNLDLSAVVCTGLAAERQAISIETQARNLKKLSTATEDSGILTSGRLKDESLTPILALGPEFLACQMPFTDLTEALTGEHLPVELSQDAGTYVCNFITYKLLMNLFDLSGLSVASPQTGLKEPPHTDLYGVPQVGSIVAPEIWAGFIHFPSFAELPYEDSLRALKAILKTLDR